jgi:hypothetical protein
MSKFTLEHGALDNGRGIYSVNCACITLSTFPEHSAPRRELLQFFVMELGSRRASVGGLLQFHASPADTIGRLQPIASILGFLGQGSRVIRSPLSGIIMGMTTRPAVKPDDPNCHIALPHEVITSPKAKHVPLPALVG